MLELPSMNLQYYVFYGTASLAEQVLECACQTGFAQLAVLHGLCTLQG